MFLASFTHWLDTHELISISAACQLLGVGTNDIYAVPGTDVTSTESGAPAPSAAATGVGLDVDDYLQGLTALPKELCRLCVNAVRSGDYALPQQIATFVSDLYSGMRCLNLRNDGLRRKFDVIKSETRCMLASARLSCVAAVGSMILPSLCASLLRSGTMCKRSKVRQTAPQMRFTRPQRHLAQSCLCACALCSFRRGAVRSESARTGRQQCHHSRQRSRHLAAGHIRHHRSCSSGWLRCRLHAVLVLTSTQFYMFSPK